MADVSLPWREVCRSVSSLADNHDKRLDTIPNDTDLAHDLAMVKICTVLFRNDKRRKDLIEEIAKQHRPAVLKPGTIGAFLWGCGQNYYGDVERACSPLCPTATNSPSVWGTGGYVSPDPEEPMCPYHVVVVEQ